MNCEKLSYSNTILQDLSGLTYGVSIRDRRWYPVSSYYWAQIENLRSLSRKYNVALQSYFSSESPEYSISEFNALDDNVKKEVLNEHLKTIGSNSIIDIDEVISLCEANDILDDINERLVQEYGPGVEINEEDNPDTAEAIQERAQQAVEDVFSTNNNINTSPLVELPELDLSMDIPTVTVNPTDVVIGNTEEEEGTAVSTTEEESGTITSSQIANGSWVFEWRPSFSIGIVKLPYERFFQDGAINVLSIDPEVTTDYNIFKPYENLILPMGSDYLVLLEDVNFSRRLIANTTITQGTKYYQVFTENFPEIKITLQVVKFGGISERVVQFFDAMTSFSANPRKYPGSFYLYDTFKERPPTFTNASFYQNAYRKYKIIPIVINKGVSSRDNLMTKITISGVVVEWERNE